MLVFGESCVDLMVAGRRRFSIYGDISVVFFQIRILGCLAGPVVLHRMLLMINYKQKSSKKHHSIY